jgi:hypothetical protein
MCRICTHIDFLGILVKQAYALPVFRYDPDGDFVGAYGINVKKPASDHVKFDKVFFRVVQGSP